jgi:tetratricopeptide (TPR) repeat protein/O-antigen ligase
MNIGVLLFLVAAAISTAFSVDPRRSLIGFAILIVAIMIFYLFVDLIRNGLPVELITKVLMIISGFIIFFGVRELYLWYKEWIDIAGYSSLIPPATYRIRAFLGHPNFVAAYFNLLLPLGLARYYLAKDRISRIVLVGWVVLVLILIFFTSSRGGWLGTFAALFTFFGLYWLTNRQEIGEKLKERIKNKWIVITLVLAIIIAMVVLVQILLWQSHHPTHPADLTEGFASRNYIWEVAREMFSENPITGNGVFTFGTEYLKTESVPPNMLLAHAHNFYFNVVAEMGIFGLIGLIGMGIGLVISIFQVWKSQKILNRTELAGLCGAIAGLAIHSMFETPQSMPLLLILPGVLVAQITAGEEPESIRIFSWSGNGSLFILWVIISVLFGFDLRGLSKYYSGIKIATAGDFTNAETWINRAVDLDSYNALYWSQLGLTKGKVSISDNGDVVDERKLDDAVEAYKKGISIEPNYSVNWANMSVLQWEGGYQDQAVESMRTAAKKSPQQAGFQIALGMMLEELGDYSSAWNAYQQAIQIDPYWMYSSLFTTTEYRISVLNYWKNRNILRQSIENENIRAGWDYMDKGLFERALDEFNEASGFNEPDVYYARAMAYRELGQIPEAERAFRTALWMRSGNERLNTEILLGLAKLSAENGDEQEALDYYLRAAELMKYTSSFGIGKGRETQYSWYIFYKPSLADDLMSGFEKEPYTDEMIDGLHYIAEWYLDNAQGELAEEMYSLILHQRPGDQAAQDRYLELK